MIEWVEKKLSLLIKKKVTKNIIKCEPLIDK